MTKSKTKNAPFRSRVLRVESLEARTLLSADGLRDYDAANADFAADSEYVSHAEIENVAEGQVAWYLPTSSV